jgi:phosphoribosylformylglycinamidine synthase
MKAAVIVFPGSNCDRDIAVALERSMGHSPAMIWHKDTELPRLDLIVVPGGFSYGDYLRAGAMAAHSPIMREVKARADSGVAVLGICNGFQILTETGLLPGVLMHNANLKFICKDVFLRVENDSTIFTGKYRRNQIIRIPIAHNEGNFFAEKSTLDRLEESDHVAFRYCGPDGAMDEDTNPNGSQRNIAGIFNDRRNVLGMMPHPERLADPRLGGTDGRIMFDGLMDVLG